MTEEEFEELKQTIREANQSPMQKMSCLICGHGRMYRSDTRCFCLIHKNYILGGVDGAMRSVCFDYMPPMEEQI